MGKLDGEEGDSTIEGGFGEVMVTGSRWVMRMAPLVTHPIPPVRWEFSGSVWVKHEDRLNSVRSVCLNALMAPRAKEASVMSWTSTSLWAM